MDTKECITKIYHSKTRGLLTEFEVVFLIIDQCATRDVEDVWSVVHEVDKEKLKRTAETVIDTEGKGVHVLDVDLTLKGAHRLIEYIGRSKT